MPFASSPSALTILTIPTRRPSDQADFVRDFSEQQPICLTDFVARLDGWRARLERNFAASGGGHCGLEDKCWQLLSWTHPLLEVPGQYMGAYAGAEPAIDQHTFVDHFSADVHLSCERLRGRMRSGGSRGSRSRMSSCH